MAPFKSYKTLKVKQSYRMFQVKGTLCDAGGRTREDGQRRAEHLQRVGELAER